MSVSKGQKDQASSQPQLDFDRRNILLSGVSLLAISAVNKAAAQTPPTPPKTEMGPAAPAAVQAAASKPNILVIWGDDIGIANISAYSNGLMGYETPNIDRIAKEGIKFQHYYGEQSCTAGRSAFLTGQHIIRTGLSKVGFPGRTDGDEPARSLHRRAAQESRLRHGPVRQEPRRRSQPLTAHGQWLRRVLRQPLPSQRRGRAGTAGLSERPFLPCQVWAARRAPLQGDRRRRPDGGSPLRQNWQTNDRGYRRR